MSNDIANVAPSTQVTGGSQQDKIDDALQDRMNAVLEGEEANLADEGLSERTRDDEDDEPALKPRSKTSSKKDDDEDKPEPTEKEKRAAKLKGLSEKLAAKRASKAQPAPVQDDRVAELEAQLKEQTARLSHAEKVEALLKDKGALLDWMHANLEPDEFTTFFSQHGSPEARQAFKNKTLEEKYEELAAMTKQVEERQAKYEEERERDRASKAYQDGAKIFHEKVKENTEDLPYLSRLAERKPEKATQLADAAIRRLQNTLIPGTKQHYELGKHFDLNDVLLTVEAELAEYSQDLSPSEGAARVSQVQGRANPMSNREASARTSVTRHASGYIPDFEDRVAAVEREAMRGE